MTDSMIEWKPIKDKDESKFGNPIITERAKVTGGWLVRVLAREGCGVAFYPDPDHTWDGGSLP